VTRVYPIHLRRCGYCLSGVRRFCARHQLDFRRLVRHGLPIDEVRATGDAMANTVADEAER